MSIGVKRPTPAATLAEAPTPSPHPLEGTEMTGADAIVQVWADEGVDTVFGYSGGAILPTYDAVFRYNADHPRARELRQHATEVEKLLWQHLRQPPFKEHHFRRQATIGAFFL